MINLYVEGLWTKNVYTFGPYDSISSEIDGPELKIAGQVESNGYVDVSEILKLFQGYWVSSNIVVNDCMEPLGNLIIEDSSKKTDSLSIRFIQDLFDENTYSDIADFTSFKLHVEPEQQRIYCVGTSPYYSVPVVGVYEQNYWFVPQYSEIKPKTPNARFLALQFYS